MSLLLDTNVLSELRRADAADAAFRKWSMQVDQSTFRISVLTVAELRRGAALKSRRDPVQGASLDAWIERILRQFTGRVFAVDLASAELWARLSVPDPLPFVDGLLAATALVHGLTLVTRNERDVARTGVRLLNPWTAPA